MTDRRVHVAATLCLTLLTAVTVVSLCRVFPDWAFLRPLLAVAIGCHVMAAALRYGRAPLWLALPLLALTLYVLVAVVFYRDTMVGPFPAGATLRQMGIDVRLVVQQFPSAVAPVPSEGSFATVIAAIIGLCAILSDTFAFRAFGRVEAIVPTAVLFVFAAALGVDRSRVPMAALWIGSALLTIAMLRYSHIRDDVTWMGARRLTLAAALPAMFLLVGVSAVAAAAVAPRLPGAGEKALIDTRNRISNVTEVLSPLVDIRSRLKNSSNLQVFTVRSSNGPHYWRVVGLPEFDGNAWIPPEEDLVPLGDRSGDIGPFGVVSTQRIVVDAMRGHFVPAAATPVRVSPGSVMFAEASQSLVLPNQTLQKGDTVDVVSVVQQPNPDALRAATTSSPPSKIYLQLPDGLPSTAKDAARTVTAGVSTDFDRLLALQTWFRAFTYDANVQLGNSNDAIAAFLRGRRGFCQQFAGTFAVMARTLGIPARVAVGYTPGDLGGDGLYHVFGRHAHAWPEVWFDGIGWVAFEPTPGRGSPDGISYTNVPAAQDDTRGVGTKPGTTPTTAVGQRPGPTTTLGGERPGTGNGNGNGATTTTAPVVAATSGGGSSSAAVVIIGLLLALVLYILLAPRVVAAWARRTQRTPDQRVVTAWYRTCHSLSLAGAPPIGGATPHEYARSASVATGVDASMLRELADYVTTAIYAQADVSDLRARRCEVIARSIDSLCRTRTPWAARVRELVDPRWMLRRATG
jgi:transglutaminase-like putative cysteine protease